MSYIGQSPPRGEDPGLVAGAHAYVADLAIEGCLEACFVRSYEAHGNLRGVDLEQARSLPGVVGAFAAPDVPGLPDIPMPARIGAPEAMSRPAMASDKVRYAGEPVAVVLAEDRYLADDAAEIVLADIDPLEAVVDPSKGAEDSAPRLFEGISNVVNLRETGEPVSDVLEAAPVVIEARFDNGRLAPTSIETRAIAVQPQGSEGLVVHCSHQAPHRLKGDLAAAFGLDAERVRVVAPKVGGAFGAKSQTYPEYLVVAYLALRLGRPIRWIEDRREALQAASHGRGQSQTVRLGATEDGRLLALEMMVDADIGAYPHPGEFIPFMTAWMMSGPYALPRLYVRTRTVVTNKIPTSAYRGAGRPEAAFALERCMDLLGRRLGLDPAELRRRNFIPADAFPYESPTGATYDSGDYASALDMALELSGYEAARAEQASRRAAGSDGPRMGVGIATWIERSGGQSGSTEYGSVEVAGDGSVVARTGASTQGQGHATSFAQVVASVLDLDLDRVRIVQGDTAEVPEGTGTFGSRSMQVGGSALHESATEVVAEGRRRAAALLEAAADDLAYAGGRFTVVGTDRGVSLAEVAATEPLVAESRFAPPQAFPFGAYVAIVEVDPETGEVEIAKLVAVDDCGVVINPAIVHGQIAGSVMQGLGQALYERLVYDEQGQILVGTLMDYSIPTAAELPPLVFGEPVTPNPNVPLGSKGAGEAGCIGAPPAVLNAIHDALELDTHEIDMPATPERVWRSLSQRTR